MNILYSGDNNIDRGLLISVLSLTKHVREPLHVYVLTAGIGSQSEPIPETFTEFLDQLVKKRNQNSFVKRFDIGDLFAKEMPAKNMATIFTPACMLRLFADQVPELPSKLLYLDTDIVCCRDFSDFYHQDMSNLELVGVLDHYGRWFFHNHLRFMDYMNSGVLLLNMDKIKQTKLFAKSRKLCMTKKMFMPDQSALNKYVRYYKLAPRRYNDQRRYHRDTVFQHFTTHFAFAPVVHTVTVKPWEVDLVHSVLHLHVHDRLLAEYQKLYGQYQEEQK
jgi:lipopolysaccharide biosynthesis glycosyltransferase